MFLYSRIITELLWKPFDVVIFYDSGMSILRAYVVKIFDEIFSNEGTNTTSMIGDIFQPHSNLVRKYKGQNIYLILYNTFEVTRYYLTRNKFWVPLKFELNFLSYRRISVLQMSRAHKMLKHQKTRICPQLLLVSYACCPLFSSHNYYLIIGDVLCISYQQF